MVVFPIGVTATEKKRCKLIGAHIGLHCNIDLLEEYDCPQLFKFLDSEVDMVHPRPYYLVYS